MKLEFNKDQLINALGIVSRAIPVRTTNPILECILFDAGTDVIRLAANDTELGIETVCSGTIVESGKIALEAKLIYEIVRKFDSGDAPVVIESNSSFMTTISCDNAVFNIQGKDGEEFSYLPAIEKDNYIVLSQMTLKDAIRKTIFSAALNDANKMMGGEYIEVRGSNVKFVALDGHRIAIRNVEMKQEFGNAKVIVPGKTVNEISKILKDDNESEVVICFSKNHILFEFDDTVIVSRLIEGEYFRIEHMLSRDYETKVNVNRNRLTGNIDRATILIRESDHKPIIFDIRDQVIRMQVKSAYGTMNGEVGCVKEGKDLMIAFNPKYLLDALRAAEDEEVSIYLTNAKAPCFIRDEKESYIYLILPVNFVV